MQSVVPAIYFRSMLFLIVPTRGGDMSPPYKGKHTLCIFEQRVCFLGFGLIAAVGFAAFAVIAVVIVIF